MKTKSLIFGALLLIFCVSLNAQKHDYSGYPGYIEFGDLTQFETGEEVTEVMIEAHLLRMVAKVTEKEDPELSDVIRGIKLIKVHTFEVTDGNYDALRDKITSINKSIAAANWDRIVRTRSNKEMVNVFIKTTGEEKIEGLVVTQVEKDGEAVFVNIVGDINLETISRLGGKFDIPGIDDLNGHDKTIIKHKD